MKELPCGTLYELFCETVKRYPEKTGLVFLGRRFTYSEINELVERLSSSLYHLGVGKGDRVIIYLATCPQWVIAWLAAARIGAIAVPITPIYTPPDLRYITQDSGAETLFCMDTNFGYVAEILPQTGVKRVIVTNVADLLPFWKRIIGKAFDKIPEGSVPKGKGVFTFKGLLKEKATLPSFEVKPEDLGEMLYTGGTTGFPKGVPHQNILFVRDFWADRKVVADFFIPWGEGRVVLASPPYHMYGHQKALGRFLLGDTLIMLPRMNLDGLFDHIHRYRVNMFAAVPTLYRMMLEHDRIDYYDLSSVEVFEAGGEVMPLEVAERWLRKFGKPIYIGWGTTETAGGPTSCLLAGKNKFPLNSLGKLMPYKEVKLVDPDTLEPVPPGEPGEALIHCENMIREYWNKPEETARCLVELDGKLWYRTGDILRVDEKGWYYFVDRTADIIKHKGYRVAASKIEAALQEHPAVVAACAVGVPDPKVGERIKAFVVLKEDVRGVTAYDLIQFCRERLAPYETPHYIEFRDMLPKSKVGKLLRREMRDDERRRWEKGA